MSLRLPNVKLQGRTFSEPPAAVARRSRKRQLWNTKSKAGLGNDDCLCFAIRPIHFRRDAR